MEKGTEPFIVFGQPDIQDSEIQEVVDTLQSKWIGTGPRVAIFQKNFSRYIGADHVAAVNSCTAALHLSLLSLGLSPDDEVITTPLTFCATINAIIHAGAKPVLADVDPVTMNIDPYKIESKVTKHTKAILPVHFAGRSCNMDAIMEIARKYDLAVVEDAAHAIETIYHGKHAGTFGDFGCFSFYVTKNVVTGEGGMVVSSTKSDMSRIKQLALHGLSKDAWNRFGDEGYKHYQVVECGYKYNMMDIQAALGIHQLARVEENWQKRQNIWKRYQESFWDLPISIPAEPEENTRHAYHLYTIMIDKKKTSISRDEFLQRMYQKGIGVGVHYISIPEHQYYQDRYDWNPSEYPNAASIGLTTVSIPLNPNLSEESVARIISSVVRILSKNS